VVVVLLLVEPVVPPSEPVLPVVPPVEPELEPEPVPLAPMELVPPLPLLPVVVSVLLEVEPVPPEEPVVLDGLVVLLELLDPVPAPEPAVPASRLLHALSERAATTARAATVACVRDVFIRNS
jgi:hypothetical protein